MKEEIADLYRKANGWSPRAYQITMEELERFAALVAASEREAIAQSLDKQADLACDEIDRQWAQEMAAAVRARSNT